MRSTSFFEAWKGQHEGQGFADGLQHLHGSAVDSLKQARRKNFGGPSVHRQGSMVQDNQTVEIPRGEVEVVDGGDDGQTSCLVEFKNQVEDLRLAGQVELLCGLVEE